jgi:hypothetical protein
VQLQEALQKRKVSSELLSTLMTPDGRFFRPPQIAPMRQTALPANSDSLAAIRSAEDIIQAAFAGPPTAEGRRIAAEAFLMEAQAQREFELQQAQGTSARRQWMA